MGCVKLTRLTELTGLKKKSPGLRGDLFCFSSIKLLSMLDHKLKAGLLILVIYLQNIRSGRQVPEVKAHL